ncbi:MAG: hypothetical protein RLZZ401_2469, partial [Pseudomonadota bacterium]
MAEKQLASLIQTYLADRARQGLEPVGAEAIRAQVNGKRPTVNR